MQGVDAANAAWVLSATALVLFMTLPGLALFYAGLVRAKNVLSVMTHCVAIACLASIVWLFGGYSLAFSGASPLLGDLGKFALAMTGDSQTCTMPNLSAPSDPNRIIADPDRAPALFKAIINDSTVPKAACTPTGRARS